MNSKKAEPQKSLSELKRTSRPLKVGASSPLSFFLTKDNQVRNALESTEARKFWILLTTRSPSHWSCFTFDLHVYDSEARAKGLSTSKLFSTTIDEFSSHRIDPQVVVDTTNWSRRPIVNGRNLWQLTYFVSCLPSSVEISSC